MHGENLVEKILFQKYSALMTIIFVLVAPLPILG